MKVKKIFSVDWLLEYLPIQQGLKLYLRNWMLMIMITFRISSNTTRIETRYELNRKICRNKLLEYLPIQQGLKLN